jgi:hypothetical protein
MTTYTPRQTYRHTDPRTGRIVADLTADQRAQLSAAVTRSAVSVAR